MQVSRRRLKAILDLASTEDSFSGCRAYYIMVDCLGEFLALLS